MSWLRARDPSKLLGDLVDLVGIEPTTSSMPWKRAPSCATGPRLKSLTDRNDTSGSSEVLIHFRPHLWDSQRALARGSWLKLLVLTKRAIELRSMDSRGRLSPQNASVADGGCPHRSRLAN